MVDHDARVISIDEGARSDPAQVVYLLAIAVAEAGGYPLRYSAFVPDPAGMPREDFVEAYLLARFSQYADYLLVAAAVRWEILEGTRAADGPVDIFDFEPVDFGVVSDKHPEGMLLIS